MNMDLEAFLTYFGVQWGFDVLGTTENKILASTKGKKYWIVLEIDTAHFHVKLEHDLISQPIFYWQNFATYEEIGLLMLKNAILRAELVHAAKRDKTRSSNAEQHV